MKQKTKRWLPYVKADMEVAHVLISQKKKTRWTNVLILWHCQQAIEKLLKAVIVEKEKELLKIHNLRRLREIGEVELPDEYFNLIIVLNKYYLQSRYPDLIYKALPNPTNILTQKLFQQTNSLHLWLLNYLEKL